MHQSIHTSIDYLTLPCVHNHNGTHTWLTHQTPKRVASLLQGCGDKHTWVCFNFAN